MYNIIERYMNVLKKEDFNAFALKNNVNLSEQELEFVYVFVKKNWQTIIANPNMFHFERYKDKFSEENYLKINKLIQEYMGKFKAFL